MTAELPFEEDRTERAGEPSLVVDVDGYEGPLDLLLYLIRRDEVDLYDIPIARVTEQYCRYVETLADELLSEGRIRKGDLVVDIGCGDGSLLRALKKRDVPVAGADRLKLGENIAILDLVALAQFAIMPEDDHALACILKSPLLTLPLDEDELIEIAVRQRRGLVDHEPRR